MRMLTVPVIVVALSASAAAQMTHRLKGSITSEAGASVASAAIRAEATAGFRGEQFVGQKEFTVTASDKGEWTMLGLTSGVWLFTASAPGMLPAAVVMPVKFSQRQQVSAVGNSLTWALPMQAVPAAEHPMLQAALGLYESGKKDEAAQAVTVALGPDVPAATRCAAGEMALALQQFTLAKAIFEQVVKDNPKHARAVLGLASAALLGKDWETAGKHLWTARDLVPRDLRPALASAIGELQAIASLK